jgi:TonB family protein
MNCKKLIAACLLGLGIAFGSETVLAVPPAKESYKHLAITVASSGLCDLKPAEFLRKYGPARELVTVPLEYPKVAKDTYAEGDAGVEFQLDATGTPRNLKIVCENPPAYGLGQALVNALKKEKFEVTASSPDRWHYQSVSLRFDTPVPKH